MHAPDTSLAYARAVVARSRTSSSTRSHKRTHCSAAGRSAQAQRTVDKRKLSDVHIEENETAHNPSAGAPVAPAPSPNVTPPRSSVPIPAPTSAPAAPPEPCRDTETEAPDKNISIRCHDWHILEFDLVRLVHNTTAFQD